MAGADQEVWLRERAPAGQRDPGPHTAAARLGGTPISWLDERAVIDRFFRDAPGKGVVVGVGDDAAVLEAAKGTVATTDLLVEGTHFRKDANAYSVGRKSLSVNLSDIAAMGATPRHALLSLVLPEADHRWLEPFSVGFMSVARENSVSLVGGDLSRGPTRMVSVTVLGEPGKRVLRIGGAKPGDDVWLSGEIGGAGDELRTDAPDMRGSRLHDPSARLDVSQAVSDLATSATDLSDGLCAGLCVMSELAQCRFMIRGGNVPVAGSQDKAPDWRRLVQAMCSGEDYELLFTASAEDRKEVARRGRKAGVRLTRIGKVALGRWAWLTHQGDRIKLEELAQGVFSHFGANKTPTTGSTDKDISFLVAQVAHSATGKGARLFTAESCTGGMLASALTSVAGSSDWYEGGVVSYSAGLKEGLLGVGGKAIRKHGVVSEQVATQMAQGCLAYKGVTHAASVTGWAGPGGGDGQQAGTVCIGWAGPGDCGAGTHIFDGDRGLVRAQAVVAALRALLGTLDGDTQDS